jgi:hypothetical protein
MKTFKLLDSKFCSADDEDFSPQGYDPMLYGGYITTEHTTFIIKVKVTCPKVRGRSVLEMFTPSAQIGLE